MNKKVVSIFGTSRAKPGDEIYQNAYNLGCELAKAGFAIANGGYGGTMQAVAHGANVNDGKIIGVTCSAFKHSKANEYISQEIRTDSLTQRLGKLIELGDAYIVLPGGTGTLLELAEVWELKNKHFISKEKPIILFGSFWRPVVRLIAIDDPNSTACLAMAENVKQAVEIIS